MDLLTTVLIITICYWLYSYFKKQLNYFKDHGVPYQPGYPLVGNMGPSVFRRKHISEVITDIYNREPEAKYIGAFDFGSPVIMLRDLELIKNITIKNFDDFPDHKGFFDETVDPLFGGNLFNMNGDRWKEARSLLSPAFTSSKMKGMFELMVACGENFVNYFAKKSASELKMVNSKDLFTKYTNDVIATCAFGISVNSLENPDNDFYVLGKKATDLDGIVTLKFFLSRAAPFLLKILNIKFVDDKVASFFTKVVKDTVAMRDEKGIHRPDMIQLMMDARGKDSKHLKLDITEMTAQAFIFFFGGFDTTSTQMCMLTHELAINPDIQKKLQDEIDQAWKETNGKPTYESINKMLYLDAVFNESVRFHTQAFFLDRMCMKAFELPPALPGAKPFIIPPGTNIWIPAGPIHKDPKYYENPETFDPDRYYEKKVTINDATNMGFGIGPRSCIGNRFAILEIKIMLFFLLSKFNLKRTPLTCKPFTYSKKTFSIRPEGGFWVALEPRG
ncbi:hypothetical protein QAD02_011301 [Eretmocerus hayati]|uniref:Uncharacterized protein n=1 Tax=Eretmocerus hayati TaxID=131215 RepID=A0ACC2NWD6_9HYME|nr:hypothetical protein QAD02_011301 [Eretmocerus hayati]